MFSLVSWNNAKFKIWATHKFENYIWTKNPTESFQIFTDVYKEDFMSHAHMFETDVEWHKRFNEGSGWPPSIHFKSEIKCRKNYSYVRENRQLRDQGSFDNWSHEDWQNTVWIFCMRMSTWKKKKNVPRWSLKFSHQSKKNIARKFVLACYANLIPTTTFKQKKQTKITHDEIWIFEQDEMTLGNPVIHKEW